MQRRLLSLLFATLSLSNIAGATGRMPPEVQLRTPFQDQQTRREDYAKATAETNAWSPEQPLPTSWLEAGLLDDATLMFIDYAFDGGTQVYYFRDSPGRYFVFRRETPLRSEIDAKGQNVLRTIPREQLRFFIGDPKIARSQAVEVPIGSACDQFLISVLVEAAKRQPPLPSAPRDEHWDPLKRNSVQAVREFTQQQSAKLGGFSPSVYLLEDISVETAKALPNDELVARLLGAPNPLRKGQPLTAVVIIPLNQADDIVRLEGYTFPADFYFTHQTKAETHVFGSNLYGVLICPVAPVHESSIGTDVTINSPSYQYAPVTEGYSMEDITSSGSGRQLR